MRGERLQGRASPWSLRLGTVFACVIALAMGYFLGWRVRVWDEVNAMRAHDELPRY